MCKHIQNAQVCASLSGYVCMYDVEGAGLDTGRMLQALV